MASVMLLEFNELTPRLMDRFIAQGALPNFKRLRDEGLAAVTDAEEAPPTLEPWIQWVTVHTGLSYAKHQVFDLGDGPKLRAPRLWDMVSDAGKRSWICGSMNAAVQSGNFNGLILPDPWATGVEPIPEEKFRPFHHFVRTYVQEYTAEKPPLSKADYLRFVRFMASHGLSLRTITNTLRQLSSEVGENRKWRRAAILDSLLWDVFKHHFRRERPALATFFLNSTAHYQHYYWRNLEPDAFTLKPSDDSQREYADAIRFGYEKMDEIVGEALRMAGDDTTIILCTALSQQPLTVHDEKGGKSLYKMRDPDALARYAGITAEHEYAPVMAEEFRFYFADDAAAEDAERKLLALKLPSGEPVMRSRRTGREIYAACVVNTERAPDADVATPYSNQSLRFDELFYRIEAGIKSGMHHPDGILWIRPAGGARGVQLDRKVSLREIAPTVLDLCGVTTSVRFDFPPMPELSLLEQGRSAA